LDLLGFIRPNRDFSVGYGGKNKKISPSSSPPDVPARGGVDPEADTHILARILIFTKKMHQKNSRHEREIGFS
jgi:hypothetical protein